MKAVFTKYHLIVGLLLLLCLPQVVPPLVFGVEVAV